MKLSDYEINSLNKFGNSITKGKWSNEGLVQLIELINQYFIIEIKIYLWLYRILFYKKINKF